MCAKRIANEVAYTVQKWREVALQLRIPNREIDRMATAFEHRELKKAT